LRSLRNIGATKTASLLKKAMDVEFGGEPPSSRADRQTQLEVDEVLKMDKDEDTIVLAHSKYMLLYLYSVNQLSIY